MFMANLSVDENRQVSKNQGAELTAYDLWKFYGPMAVVQGVNFTLYPGEVLGLLGPNGAGKTTIVGMLYGRVVPSRGFARFGSYHIQTQGKQARACMGIVTQDDNLDPDFTVWENLVNFARYYRIVGKEATKRAGEVLAQVNLQNRKDAKIDELSGGMKRRLVLARALLNHPQVVFLDEPTTGLDPDARQDFWQLIVQLKQGGCGILLTTHYMEEAQRLCDRLLLLQQGQVIDEGTPTALIKRTVGTEMVEIEGIDGEPLRQLAKEHQVWMRTFGSSYLIALPATQPELLWEKLHQLQSTAIRRRNANLDDVFLKLTGTEL
jgi:lipooligosaccharide transport system ATP-binding protein